MKTLRNSAILILLSAGYLCAQNITVEGEKKLNTDFKKYKTFAWMSNDQKQGNQIVEYTYAEIIDPNAPMTASSNKAVRKEEKKEDKQMMKDDKKMMKGDKKMGRHHRNEGEVVIYSYSFVVPSQDSSINNAAVDAVEDQLEGRGYRKNASNPDLLVAYKIFDRRSQIKGYNAPPTEVNNIKTDEVHQPQDTVTYALKPGTVLISLLDAKTGSVVWEGFASGVGQKDYMIDDKQRVKEAVNLIFKKYEFRADKLSMTN